MDAKQYETVIKKIQEKFGDSGEVPFDSVTDFGAEWLLCATDEESSYLREVSGTLSVKNEESRKLIPGERVLTPVGTMLIPTERPAWILEEAIDLLLDIPKDDTMQEIENIRTEFNFVIGYSIIVADAVHAKQIRVDINLAEIVRIIFRSIAYRDRLVDVMQRTASEVLR
jgi:tRNA uridine 5-carbamoylmethylation protein Kti12